MHHSAKASHYDTDAKDYDTLNEEKSREINETIAKFLAQHSVKTVLDFTCGTGSQVVYLSSQGFEVTGVDINAKMLEIARAKAKNIELIEGDMRTTEAGKFDAVVTVFNAVGHLTKADFEAAVKNINHNLVDGGLYLFDIFNLSYLLSGDNISKLTIDWLEKQGDRKVRKIQYSTIDKEGILASYTTSLIYRSDVKEKTHKGYQTLQVYTGAELRSMLERNGFEVLEQCNVDGTMLQEIESERILTISRKIASQGVQ